MSQQGTSRGTLTPASQLQQESEIEQGRVEEILESETEPEPQPEPESEDEDKDARDYDRMTSKELIKLVRELVKTQSSNAISTNTISAKKRKMKDPEAFCGGPDELAAFLNHLEQNFELYPDFFPDERSKVAYACDLMSTWSRHPDPAKRHTNATDPKSWVLQLRRSDDRCLRDYEQFKKELEGLYGDKECEDKAIKKLMQGYEQTSRESVREWKNRLQELWRQAGWLGKYEEVLYGIAWAGLHDAIKTRIAPLATNRKFESLDELFEKAAAAERRREPEQYNDSSKQPRSKKRHHSGSVANTQETTATVSKPEGKPRAPWVSKDVYMQRVRDGQCVRCAKKGHEGKDCRTYAPAAGPPALKKQRSFDPSQKDSKANSTTNGSKAEQSKN